MERRGAKRIGVEYKAELIYGGKQFECVIEDLSSDGTCIITASTSSDIEFKPDEMLELRFQPNTGETFNLKCKVRWVKQILPHRLTCRIGLEITNPSWEHSTYFL